MTQHNVSTNDINHRLYGIFWNALKEGRGNKWKKNATIKIITSLLSKTVYLNRFIYRSTLSYKTMYWTKMDETILSSIGISDINELNQSINFLVNCLFLKNGASVPICGISIFQMRAANDDS